MTSKKKPSEGIALLSMYNDDEDDEEMEDIEEQEDQQHIEENGQDNKEATIFEEDSRMNDATAADEASTPQQPPLSPKPPSDSRRSRRGRFTIVDYGHDEVAMSPEPEVTWSVYYC